MRRREEDFMTGNLVAMIDVVFQIIIFFVCTSHMQDTALDERIRLAMAPNGQAVTTRIRWTSPLTWTPTAIFRSPGCALSEGRLYIGFGRRAGDGTDGAGHHPGRRRKPNTRRSRR